MKQLATVVFILPLTLLLAFFVLVAQPLAPDGTLLPTVPFSRLTLGMAGPILFLFLTYCLSCPIGFFFADVFHLLLGRGDGRYRRPLLRRIPVGPVWLDGFALLAVSPFLYGLLYLFTYAYLSGAIPVRMVFAAGFGILQGIAAFGVIRSYRLVCFWRGLGHDPAAISRTLASMRFFAIASLSIGIVLSSVLVMAFIPPHPWDRPKVDGKPEIIDAACVRVEEVFSPVAEADAIVFGSFPLPTVEMRKRPDRQELAVSDLRELLTENPVVARRFLEGTLDRADECLLRASRTLWEKGAWGPWTFREIEFSKKGGLDTPDSTLQGALESFKRTAQFADLVGCEMPTLLRHIDLSDQAIRNAPTTNAAMRRTLLWIAAQQPEDATRSFNRTSARRSMLEVAGEIRSESRPFFHGTDNDEGVHHIVPAVPAGNRGDERLATTKGSAAQDALQPYQYPANIVLFPRPLDGSDRGIRIHEAPEVANAREAFHSEWLEEDQDDEGATRTFFQLTEVAGIGMKEHAPPLRVGLRQHSSIRVVELNLAPTASEPLLPTVEDPNWSGADFLLVTVAGKSPHLLPEVAPVLSSDSAGNHRSLHAALEMKGPRRSVDFLRRHARGQIGAVTPLAFFIEKTDFPGRFYWLPRPSQNIVNFSYARFSTPTGSGAPPRCLSEVVHRDGKTPLIQAVDQCRRSTERQLGTTWGYADSVRSLQGTLQDLGCPLLGFEYPSSLKNWQPKLTATALEVTFPLEASERLDGVTPSRLCHEAAERRNLPRNAIWSMADDPKPSETRTCVARFWVGYRPAGTQKRH